MAGLGAEILTRDVRNTTSVTLTWFLVVFLSPSKQMLASTSKKLGHGLFLLYSLKFIIN